MTSPTELVARDMNTVGGGRLREILAGCEGVTPGPWKGGGFMISADAHISPHYRVTVAHTGIVGNPPSHAKIDECNAAHLRRLDPQTVSSIVSELLELRALQSSQSKERTDE